MAAADTRNAPRPPALVERFVKQLNIASKAVRLYPASSELPRESAASAAAALHQILQRQPSMEIVVTRDGLFHEGAAIFPASGAVTAFARDLYARQLASVRFHAGCTAEELVSFLRLLDTAPDEIASAGGFSAQLWEAGVVEITVAEMSTRIVDAPETGDEAQPDDTEGEPWPPSPKRLDELLAGAMAGRPRDRRLLVRGMSEAALVRAYLREDLQGRGVAPDELEVGKRIASLARGLQFELPEDKESLLRSLAEAVLDLDPAIRQRLLARRLLEEARHDESVAAVIRQLSLDEAMNAILNEIPETDAARSGLSRAVRNLAMIGMASSKDAVFAAADGAMRAHGMSDGDVSAVLEGAAPARLEARPHTRSSEVQPVESVLRLLDLTPGAAATHGYDEGAARLRAEASRGLTDGDVLSCLVTIATLERRPAEFGDIMRLLDESLGLLVDAGEFVVAADAAEALTLALADPSLEADLRARMGELLQVLARPGSMRAITSAMRVYRHDSAEHAACRRLLSVLGAHTISPLLEVLAEEPDMTARKAIVDLISETAPSFVHELGHRVADRRWYFVRNVVAILGGTRDPVALQYLERTLRHGDDRVRRETIRAVAAIRDARSDEMLVAALGDDDAVNVQLAARYAGLLGIRGAVSTLEQVARGEGRGNRDNGPRVEAIEALGRIGAPSSEMVLDELAKQRGLIASRTRDIRAAATAALGAVRAKRMAKGAGA